ncbi:hypothetical protein [Noviherbaspirillum album]|nr:hypothetical protein [Noviherbaspirillum sp. CPCC 100848]
MAILLMSPAILGLPPAAFPTVRGAAVVSAAIIDFIIMGINGLA